MAAPGRPALEASLRGPLQPVCPRATTEPLRGWLVGGPRGADLARRGNFRGRRGPCLRRSAYCHGRSQPTHSRVCDKNSDAAPRSRTVLPGGLANAIGILGSVAPSVVGVSVNGAQGVASGSGVIREHRRPRLLYPHRQRPFFDGRFQQPSASSLLLGPTKNRSLGRDGFLLAGSPLCAL